MHRDFPHGPYNENERNKENMVTEAGPRFPFSLICNKNTAVRERNFQSIDEDDRDVNHKGNTSVRSDAWETMPGLLRIASSSPVRTNLQDTDSKYILLKPVPPSSRSITFVHEYHQSNSLRMPGDASHSENWCDGTSHTFKRGTAFA
jgi:hypothetical protein